MNKAIITITQGVTKMPAWRMSKPADFVLEQSEHIAIVGPNGGGKTMLTDILTGRHPLLANQAYYDFAPSTKPLVSDNIKYIAFRDTYGGDNDRTYFLQQRWNQMEIDHETPTAGNLLEEAFKMAGSDTPQRRQRQQFVYELLDMKKLLDKFVILLSSGELRKLKLAEALFGSPRVMIIDNPFIGLDAFTRDQLKMLLTTLAKKDAMQLILVMSKSDDIPDFITHVVEVKDMTVGRKTTLSEYRLQQDASPTRVLDDRRRQAILTLPESQQQATDSDNVIQMRQVSIRYGERTILDKLDWTVRKGECWALSGKNGSGKSTLLSLVCADNPQAYACDITLFGKERGSGETIWDIKRHIGYVSPEMHRAYHRDMPAIRIVASGLKDSVGLYVRPTDDDYDRCRWWMDIFGIGHLSDRSYLQLSSGEQRMVLLARAFVKDPALLILDEPLHGLDNHNRRLVKDIIEAFCMRRQKTMVMVTHYEDELPACINHRLELRR